MSVRTSRSGFSGRLHFLIKLVSLLEETPGAPDGAAGLYGAVGEFGLKAVQHAADVGGARVGPRLLRSEVGVLSCRRAAAGRRVRRSRSAAALHERMYHGHVHVQIVRLLEAFAADHAGELQVRLRLVLSHVILERRPLAALETAHLAPETHTEARGEGRAPRRGPS